MRGLVLTVTIGNYFGVSLCHSKLNVSFGCCCGVESHLGIAFSNWGSFKVVRMYARFVKGIRKRSVIFFKLSASVLSVVEGDNSLEHMFHWSS